MNFRAQSIYVLELAGFAARVSSVLSREGFHGSETKWPLPNETCYDAKSSSEYFGPHPYTARILDRVIFACCTSRTWTIVLVGDRIPAPKLFASSMLNLSVYRRCPSKVICRHAFSKLAHARQKYCWRFPDSLWRYGPEQALTVMYYLLHCCYPIWIAWSCK